MTESPRIEELRRRVQSDPTSIAFAALAEEDRRAGRFEEAIEVCRSGLTRHPAYISARVTLGRALLEVNKVDEAAAELEQVLKIAPENLTATRALTEIAARRAADAEAAPAVADHSPVAPVVAPTPEPPPAPVAAQPPKPRTPIPVSTTPRPAPMPSPQPAHEGVVDRLQHFLNGIRSAKAQRSDRAAR